ncbi:hypothetical protein PAPYR_9426 [Paratrimastix pyriformis]|uniref:Uncharacterized protein n=1 Tax=Paratrimastix pyriformis TaxID=342808 RepID=A0ABQ8U8C7_9EUKA|nr:hypothetical protein PAPYR_9426 [Paratrimastix pyriformis]
MPQWAVLDEATSSLPVRPAIPLGFVRGSLSIHALDTNGVGRERRVYGLLLRARIGLLSVSHRPQLRAFHQRVLHLGMPGRGRQHLPEAVGGPPEAEAGAEEDECGSVADRQGWELEVLPDKETPPGLGRTVAPF